jgi:hypothetical protein
MQVLVVNTGSSSLKLRLLNGRDQVVKTADPPVRDPGGPCLCPVHLLATGGEPERRSR